MTFSQSIELEPFTLYTHTHNSHYTNHSLRTEIRLKISVLSLLGQQQQFHFAFGQRPFHFPADPLSGFRMPPIGNCQSKYFLVSVTLEKLISSN